MPFNWITEQQAISYFRDPAAYHWEYLDIRCKACEIELAQQKFIHTLNLETLRTFQRLRNEFDQTLERMRPVFREAFGLKEFDSAPRFEDVAPRLLSKEGAQFRLGIDYIADTVKFEPDAKQVRDFMERCPPFSAMLIALTVALYDRCIRRETDAWIGKAGREDVLSASYLPYCDRFVTNDVGQAKMLEFLSSMTGLNTEVITYAEFKRGLFGVPR
ncbi:MAG: hypothetical protein ACRD22_11400 [Terriglobia bacterium]